MNEWRQQYYTAVQRCKSIERKQIGLQFKSRETHMSKTITQQKHLTMGKSIFCLSLRLFHTIVIYQQMTLPDIELQIHWQYSKHRMLKTILNFVVSTNIRINSNNYMGRHRCYFERWHADAFSQYLILLKLYRYQQFFETLINVVVVLVLKIHAIFATKW